MELTTENILDFVRTRRAVSFAEIVRHFEGAEGDMAIFMDGYPNLILWPGLSAETVAVILELLNSKRLIITPTTPFVYFVDSAVPKMPVARQKRHYKAPHWLPVVLDTPKGR